MPLALVSFNTDISLGTVLAAASVIFALYKFHISNVTRITTIEGRVTLMWNVFKQRFNISDEEEQEVELRIEKRKK